MNKIEIYCAGCNKYLGEIRDAKLRKGIAYACAECSVRLKTSKNKDNICTIRPEEFDRFMQEHGDILEQFEKDPRYKVYKPE
ncbi:MAG: hypothetical protein HQK79_22445 [Desulfobacterales bacterium]|nr:hypothetical protein [Desulfobacterales bacterium]